MLNENFVYVGLLLSIYGSLDYLIKTVKGEVKPNRVTWFLWAVIPFIAFAAELQKGVGIQSILTFIVGFNPIVIFTASFLNKKSYWQIGPLDIICGILSVIAILLWLITKEANVAIILAIIADALAALPTVIKSFKYPETETPFPYFLFMTNALLVTLTIKSPTLAHLGFPVYIFVLNITLFILIKFKPGKLFT